MPTKRHRHGQARRVGAVSWPWPGAGGSGVISSPGQSAYKMLAGNSADTLYVHRGVVASSAHPCTAVAIFAGSSFLKRPAGDANHRQDSRWACGEDGVGDNE